MVFLYFKHKAPHPNPLPGGEGTYISLDFSFLTSVRHSVTMNLKTQVFRKSYNLVRAAFAVFMFVVANPNQPLSFAHSSGDTRQALPVRASAGVVGWCLVVGAGFATLGSAPFFCAPDRERASRLKRKRVANRTCHTTPTQDFPMNATSLPFPLDDVRQCLKNADHILDQ